MYYIESILAYLVPSIMPRLRQHASLLLIR